MLELRIRLFLGTGDYRMIKNGQKVSLEYTVFLEDGTQIDTNVGEDPLVFVLGEHKVFPALEQALMGLQVGDCHQVLLPPEDAYGPWFPDAFREVDLDAVPASYRFEGAVLGVQDPQGGVFRSGFTKSKRKKSFSTSTIRSPDGLFASRSKSSTLSDLWILMVLRGI